MCRCVYFIIVVVVAVIIPASLVAAAISPEASNVTTAQSYGFTLGKYDLYVIKQSINNHREQSLVLFNNDSNSQTLNITIPQAKKFSSGASNVDNNTVYLAGDEGTIVFLNVYTGDVEVLYKDEDPKTKVHDLQYFNNTLYWVANRKMLVSLDLQNRNTSTLINMSNDDLLMGLSVNKNDGSLYYSIWPRSSSSSSSPSSSSSETPTINKLVTSNKNYSSTVVASNQQLPRALYHHVSQLYYVSSPPGHHFLIKTIDDSTGDESMILKQRHKYCSGLAATCKGELYWSDVVNKMAWKVGANNDDDDKDEGESHNVAELGRGVVTVFGRGCTWNELMELEAKEEQEDLREQERKEKEAEEERMAAMMKLEGSNLVDSVKVNNDEVVVSPAIPTTTKVPETSIKSLLSDNDDDSSSSSSTIRLCSQQESDLIGCHEICVFQRSPTCLSNQKHGPISPSTTNLVAASSSSLQQQSPPSSSTSYDWPPYIIALVSVLSTVATIMTLVSVYMTVRVRSLSKKPIIRRRVVVSRSQSESNSGGGVTNPTSVCEMIDIENCCNMNVCETPCYERTLLQPGGASSSSGSSSTVISVNSSNSSWGPCTYNKKDDNRCLLTR